MHSPKVAALALAVAGTVSIAAPAFAADAVSPTLVIQNHRFQPEEITIPAGQQVEITVINKDATPEEFESHALHIEKVIVGGSKATVRVGPLNKGTYPFVGEFHEDTAKGRIVVK